MISSLRPDPPKVNLPAVVPVPVLEMINPYSVLFVSNTTAVPYQSTSSILRPDLYHDGTKPHIISSQTVEVYGDDTAPDVVRIGNGSLGGPTGLLAVLCQEFLSENRLQKLLRIEWVRNHSRHTQIAVQAGVVDIGLTYEREEEDVAAKEGWSQTVDILLNDHFVLAGPRSNPARLPLHDIASSLRRLALEGLDGNGHVLFHTRGDGSATMHKEDALWNLAQIPHLDRDGAPWYHRLPGTPHEALVQANQERAYLLTDRATFLMAKSRGEIEDMVIFNEGGDVLLNACAIIVRSGENRKMVMDLVGWLRGNRAQCLIEQYGKGTKVGLPYVTRRDKAEVDEMGELQ